MAHAPKKLAIDCLKYYELERYLFDEVYRRFRAEGSLGAFDFFSIINWTATRAKSHIASALLKANTRKPRTLEAITRRLTSAIHNAKNSKERFRVVTVDWRLPLPTASAILAVCCPDEFIVFDYRVRELIDFREVNYYGDKLRNSLARHYFRKSGWTN